MADVGRTAGSGSMRVMLGTRCFIFIDPGNDDAEDGSRFAAADSAFKEKLSDS
jgi:hypothetical protein